MNKLSKRLNLICDLVNGRVIADVGCDHGKLTRELFDKGKIDYAYVSDISSASLQKAIDLLSPFAGKFEAICCDGLQKYPQVRIDECIIAGMGGYEIMKIMRNAKIDIKTYILSPQHDIIELKEYLIQNNFEIVFDIIILDKGKFYNIIKCNRSNKKCTLDGFSMHFGKDNFVDSRSDICKYIDKNLAKYIEIKNNQKVQNDKIDRQISLLKKAKKELNYE